MYNVTGNGQGIYNTIGASAGIASLLGLRLGNLFCNGTMPVTEGKEYVTKDELNYVQALAAKDSEIALLKSEQNTEVKIADVYERIMTRVNADKSEQTAINTQQGIYNATANSAIAVMQSQIASLQSLTKCIIPADNVCPKPMPQYNSWTAPAA